MVKYKLWTKVSKLEAKKRNYCYNNGKRPAIKFDPVEKLVLYTLPLGCFTHYEKLYLNIY